jgi:NAD(P)-dependent dehydrogenase (short-subunit alcohol dehydrogenase family)
MTLELGSRKVVVTGEERELVRTSAESVSHDEADVVIWIREWEGGVSELKRLLAKIEAQVASQPPNGTSPHISLWRQTMAQKSYW